MVPAVAGAAYFGVRLGTVLLQAPASWPVDSRLFSALLAGLILVAASGMLAYRVANALTLAYGIDRNGIYVFWLDNRMVVPIGRIERIEQGAAVNGLGHWLQSLGFYHGRTRLPGGRTLYRFSSIALSRALILHTADAAYAVSPADADAFVQELEQRRRLGVIQQLTPGIEPGRYFFYAFWVDPVVRWGLGLAVLLNLGLLGWLMSLYPQLPLEIALRANAVGDVVGTAPRYQILFLPLAAAVLILVNAGLGMTLYLRQAVGARLLQISSVILQICFMVAVLTIVY
ncbi:MAG: hypothetical protein HC822_09805 [Oscillochloris sp.]|nr:hypothetical protein [Oscillochloris sp.]